MRIHLPAGAWIGNIDQFIRSFDTSDEKVLEITSHEKWVSVHPVVLCMITALGLFMRKHKSKINFQKMEAKSKHYFERMGLFRALDLNSEMTIISHDPTGRFIPIQKITNSEELDNFIKEMIPLLHVGPSHAEPIKYVMSELVRNVLEHANTTDGAIVCAQYYKKSNTIRLGVVDTGLGIKSTLFRYYHPKTDSDAILLALTPGVTGTTKKVGGTEFNAGAGLFFIKSLAKIKRNNFMIYSGNGMYKLLKTQKGKQIKILTDPRMDRISCGNNFPFWRGTVVAIDLCLDEDIDFKRLLDLIGEAYREAYREAKRGQAFRYKRPRFLDGNKT